MMRQENDDPAKGAGAQRALHAALAPHLPTLGPMLARRAAERGLCVTCPDGTQRPIPIAATPVVLAVDDVSRRRRLASSLSSAGVKAARHAVADPALRAVLRRTLSPLEWTLSVDEPLAALATTRVDFFVDEHGAPRALELNATIPAMQGYSDIAAGAFLDVVGAYAGASADEIGRWKAKNGSNASALLRALVAAHRRARGRDPRRVALLCRRADAQLTELVFLRDHFRAAGVDAVIAWPDTIVVEGDDVFVEGHPIDVVYRHLFVRRLDEAASVAPDDAVRVRHLLQRAHGRNAQVLNPPASPVEVKATFALLSQAAQDEALAAALALSEEERAAVAAAVPWTRVFTAAVYDDVVAQPDRYVLKRSWDYGGRAVFVGAARDSVGFVERARSAWPDLANATWEAVCARAVVDDRGGGFIVQERVATTTQPHVIAHAERLEPLALTVDYSAFASVGIDEGGELPWGGVCRGSTSCVVNIQGGGGVLPLLQEDVAAALLARLSAR